MSSRLLALATAACLALALLSQPQDGEDAEIIEGDYRVTSVEGRQRAVENLLSSVAEHRQSGQMIEAARALNRVGRFRIRMFQTNDAVTAFQEALRLLEQQTDIKTQIDSLNGLAFAYNKLSKCKLSEPSANQAFTLSDQNNYVAGKAESLLILSDCQNFRDHVLALKTAQESLTLWSSIGRNRGIADAHLAIAHYQMAQHNLEDCAKSLDAALSIFRELNDVVQQAEVLIYFGYIEFRKAAWQSSLDYYTRAESMIDKEAEPYKMGQITIGLGDSFLESGMPEVAIRKYQESLDYFRITQNPRAMSIVKWSMGTAQYFSGQYETAIDTLQTARSEAQSSGDVTLSAFCDDFLGRTYQAQNNDSASLSYFQSALDGYSKARNTREAARVLALMGQVYQQQGHFQKARDNYQASRETFRSLTDRPNESATLYALGTLELQENNLDKATEYLQHSIALTEEVRSVSSSSDLAAAFSATVYDRYETYVDCLMRKHFANPGERLDVKALETSDLSRGRSLAELLRATQTNLAPGVEPQLAEREKSLRQTLIVKGNHKISLLAEENKQKELKALELETARLETEYKQVTDLINSRHPAYRELNQPTGWDLKQIQEQVIVDDETSLVEYSLGADRSYAWVITRQGITSHVLPSESVVNESVQNVHDLLKTKPGLETDKQLTEAIHKLSSMVLMPVAAQLSRRRIIVVADGALNYIPFQILHSQPDKYEPLVATCEVISAPSASILGQLRQETARRNAPAKALAAFGDPVFPSNYAQHRNAGSQQVAAAFHLSETDSWRSAVRDLDIEEDTSDPAAVEPLLFSRIELANLRTVAGADSLVATGFDASREKLAGVDLRQYAILHIATHGVLHPKYPEKSGLLLSLVNRDGQMQNGFLGLQDVYSLNAPVELVVLSACRTGLGQNVRGEGLIGLTRGFMYAGASSVVASLWKVDDEATAELMKRFYANMLQEGMTPAAALRAAQNSIRQQPQWSSPYYWAAFTLQGDYRQTIKPMPQRTWATAQTAILAGALGTLLAIALWFYFRRRAQQSS